MNERRERLLELLERWEEQGGQVSPAELCADCAELREDLEEAIRYQAEWKGAVEAVPQQAHGVEKPKPVIPNYDILEPLGQGGMGVVYRAHDRRLKRIVALKVIREELAPRADLDRFQREAEAVARLNHPHIVQVYEVGRWQPAGDGAELPYLAMEYIPGDDLERRLERCSVEAVEAARLVHLLARAVQHAHDRGIIHRDLKPSNVLLAPPPDKQDLNTDLRRCARISCPFGGVNSADGSHSSIRHEIGVF